jgi:DNA-binding Xre family transcriptional regulator
MTVSYKKLWHLLIDRDMKKKDLQEQANLTPHVMRKLSHDEAVTTDTLAKLCRCLGCKADDIIDFPDDPDYSR